MAIDYSTAPKPPEFPEMSKVVCRVVLTPEQRERVLAETGRDLTYVDLPDADGDLTREIGTMAPQDITPLILLYAVTLNEQDEAMREYLEELDIWQKEAQAEEDKPEEERPDFKVKQEIERIKLYYAPEADAIKAAMKEATSKYKKSEEAS